MLEYRLNGELIQIEANADLTRRLLDVIRDDHGLTGTKEGCGEGECGACLVFIDGEIYNACLVPLANVIDQSVVTIEAYAKTEEFTRIAGAFSEAGAVQCGYCTPGMVMATSSLLKKQSKPTLQDVKEGLSGNLCRCTGYQTIFEAVQKAAEQSSAQAAGEPPAQVAGQGSDQGKGGNL